MHPGFILPGSVLFNISLKTMNDEWRAGKHLWMPVTLASVTMQSRFNSTPSSFDSCTNALLNCDITRTKPIVASATFDARTSLSMAGLPVNEQRID